MERAALRSGDRTTFDIAHKARKSTPTLARCRPGNMPSGVTRTRGLFRAYRTV